MDSSPLIAFLRELKRRRVVRVALVYGVVAWLVIQVAHTVFPYLDLPEWSVTLFIVLALLGFPLALVLAWAFQVTPSGVERATSKGEDPGPDEDADRFTAHGGGYARAGLALITLAAVAVAGFLLVSPGDRPPPVSAPDEISIAVLPFANLSDDPQDEYFSDGVTDDILTHLSKIPDLRVISRTSTMGYKGTTRNVREIAAELSVTHVLEGTVRRDGRRLRISAQLIEAPQDRHVWAETFDRELDDVFAIQSEVAGNVALGLRATLTSAVRDRIDTSPTDDLEAYALSLRGRHVMDPRSEAGIRQAIGYFEQAIEQDSTYARAHAWLADAHLLLATWGLAEDPASSIERARERARTSLDLDPLLAEGWVSLGYVAMWYDWAWDLAESHFQRAIDLQPSYATAHHWYSILLSDLGRFEEAEAAIRRARALDPLSLIIHTISGRLSYFTGELNDAVAEHTAALELEPSYAVGHMWLGLALEARGNLPLALEQFRRAAELDPENPVLLAGLAHGLAVAGEESEAREMLERLEAGIPGKYASPLWIGVIYGDLGEMDLAFEALERGLAERDGWMTHLSVDPVTEPLRSDPRWSEFVRRMNLSPQ